MYSRPSTPTDVLALLYCVSGALCLVGAARPMDPRTPVLLLTVLGAIGLAGGVVVRTWGRRVGPVAVHVALGLIAALVGLLSWCSATALGIVGLGPVLLAVGFYVGHFLTVRAARWHVLVLVTVASAGAWAAEPSGFLSPWLCVVVATVALAEVQARLARNLRTVASVDPLTGVANRRAWEEDAERHLARAARTGEPLVIALLDLDGFKQVNDQQGHAAGDALLQQLTAGWRTRLRRADSLGRYGGDEFVLCLPATDDAGAAELLAQLATTHDASWSAGAAAARRTDTLETVLARADAALYEDKNARRDALASPR
jgi:diguanylate cyclase (GGDEF)-like protein